MKRWTNWGLGTDGGPMAYQGSSIKLIKYDLFMENEENRSY